MCGKGVNVSSNTFYIRYCSKNQDDEPFKSVTLRPTVSQPVNLGVRRPSGTRDQFHFLLKIFFRQLQVCNFVAPSLTRGSVYNLLYN
jgi:hypothetical protein